MLSFRECEHAKEAWAIDWTKCNCKHFEDGRLIMKVSGTALKDIDNEKRHMSILKNNNVIDSFGDAK